MKPRTERGRLTALYGALLLLAGGGLVALVYLLVGQGLYTSVSGAVSTVSPALRRGERQPEPDPARSPVPAGTAAPGEVPSAEELKGLRVYTHTVSDAVTEAAQRRLLSVSLLALAVFAVLSIWLAWWMAGRVLRPVAVITGTARRLSGENLHERIALDAPPGELKELADTFDAMLGRMEHLVSAQRRFAANAAHELRTPLAVQRAAAEIGLAGDPPPERVARIRTKLIGVADASEHLIESLLLLAVSEEGLESGRPVERVDVAELAAAELAACAQRGLTVQRTLAPLAVAGDRTLLGHLVRNLVGNAVRHNRAGGRLAVATTADGELTVSNTGPLIDPADAPMLLEPFRRRAARQHTAGEGAGLGLSIVASIARAHGAELVVRANPAPDGGLTVSVRFPPREPGGPDGVR
ncbi:sensor histidine kinase [Streptomyces sp. NPDC057011]|uniref:sensor histidine kinase n=1 Tax=unclassified Streptomyces TaxID=2593676 RepID=UPI00363FA10B